MSIVRGGGAGKDFYTESDERQALRKAVGELGKKYGYEWFDRQARSGGNTSELWLEAGKLGYLGVNLPEEYGGGGGGMGDLSIVLEELGAAGCPLLMMVVSSSIVGTVITRFGTDAQKQRWLPGLADGSTTMAFAITEPDAGSNSHNITTTARRTEDGWSLSGRKVYISGLDVAQAVLVVGRTEDTKTGRLKPALFIVPTDAPGIEFQPIEMDLISPDKQFTLFLDDVQLPREALVGAEDAALMQLFAGLNPERIMASAFALGIARHALGKAVAYVKERQVWKTPIGAHQGIAHPLAQVKIELELARLMMQKAAALYDAGDDLGAGEAANMAKFAAAEVAVRVTDQAVQSLGGNGLTKEYGVASLSVAARAIRVAPVSREMILNFVAQHSLGLPKSY
jgi:alkylation response protein AidB-like acyl-CoA dehydrogenase